MINLHAFDWEVLDRSKHDYQGFSSEYEAFTQHLHIDAIMEQASGLSQTRVCTDGRIVIAYYTAKCTKIRVDAVEMREIGAKENAVPAIEIPMLAVDRRYLRQGVGSEMIEEILAQTNMISHYTGCRYLFLRAVKEPWLLEWYKRYSFKEIPFEVRDEYTQPMSYKLPTVRELTESEYEELF